MDELKPCAHCGGKAEWDSSDTDGSVCIVCDSCAIRTGWTGDDTEAIAAWNRRAPDADKRIAELEADTLASALASANAQIDALRQDNRDLRNSRLMGMSNILSSAELKLVDKHCEWPAFKCAFDAVMKSRRAALLESEAPDAK